MSTPGWYPDPGGRPGHYRLWDGQAWGLSTSADPPGGPAGGPPPPPRRRRTAAWVVAGAVLLVVLAVVAALALRPDPPVALPSPSPSASRTVDSPGPSSVAPSTAPSTAPSNDVPSPRIPSPTRPASASASASPSEPCPVGNPFSRQDYPRDGRVHGGSLSFPRQRGWEDQGPQASAFTWAYDLGETDAQLEQSRYAAYAVGAVSVADGFEDPRSAAQLAMRCTVGSALYSDVSSRTDLVNEETTVDGYRAWTLRSEIRTYDARTSYAGDTVQITVVDLDSPEALAFFWGSAPIGNQQLTDRLDQVVDRLRVD